MLLWGKVNMIPQKKVWFFVFLFVISWVLFASAGVFAFVNVSLLGPPDNSLLNISQPSFTFNASSDLLNTTFTCALIINGAFATQNTTLTNFSIVSLSPASNLAEDNFTWQVNCSDANGSLATATRSGTIDTIDPQYVISARGGADSVFINVTATDIRLKSVTLYFFNASGDLRNTMTSLTNNITLTYNSLPEGRYLYNLSAVDWAGNMNVSPLFAVFVDRTPPTIQFSDPTETDGVSLNRTNIQVTVSAQDNLNFSNITIYLSNRSGSLLQTQVGFTQTFFYNFTGLQNGTYIFNATAYDLTGNSNSTVSRTVTLAYNVPPASTSSTSNSNSNSQTTEDYWTTTYDLSGTDLQDQGSLAKNLLTRERLHFKLSGSDYYLGLIDISSNTATFNLSSGQEFTLTTGESKKISLQGGDTYNVKITLSSLTALLASITLASINERVSTPALTNQPVVNSQLNSSLNSNASKLNATLENLPASKSNNTFFIVTLLIVALVLGSILFYVLHIKKDFFSKSKGFASNKGGLEFYS